MRELALKGGNDTLSCRETNMLVQVNAK